jgi:hypothetical protein
MLAIDTSVVGAGFAHMELGDPESKIKPALPRILFAQNMSESVSNQ